MSARRSWLGVGTAAVLAVGCGSSSPSPPPLGSASDDGGVNSGDATAEASGARDAGDASVDHDAAEGGDASSDDASDGGSADAGLPLCAGMTWDSAPATSWITGVQRFGGITPDELAVVWISDGSTVSVATRPHLAQDFDTPYATIPIDPTTIANDRVALSKNGQMVIAVSMDRSTFVAYTNQGSTWGPAPTDPFPNLRAMAMDTQGQFFEPMLGADGNFYYLFAPSGAIAGPPAIYQSTWNGQQLAWNTGVVLSNPELASSSATVRRRPTGMSEDGRTLFFFDEVAGSERTATRLSPDAPFTTFADLPAFPEAAPSGLCEHLYFVEGDAIESAD